MTNSSDRRSWRYIDTIGGYEDAVAELTAGVGPIGVDTERASGFRYSNRAYLIQFARKGSQTFLFDPTAIDSFELLQGQLSPQEWILHAATQDLPCLREAGLNPTLIFDTELASRLLGLERVGLGAVVAELLNIELEKAHGASDWSTRPLPLSWLEYAALDVSLLPELKTALQTQLAAANKLDFAREEFEYLVHWQPKESAAEPWRRLSSISKINSPRQLAIARSLWEARDTLGRERDVAPGRLLPDSSIIAASLEPPRSRGHLAAMKTFVGRASRSELDLWWQAVIQGKETEDVPELRVRAAGIPNHRSWPQRFPDADVRLKAVRAELQELSASLKIPLENLLSPQLLRAMCFNPPETPDIEQLETRLREIGARSWQARLSAPAIQRAFTLADSGHSV